MSSYNQTNIQEFFKFTGLTPEQWKVIRNIHLRKKTRAAYRRRGHDQGIGLARHINTIRKILGNWDTVHCKQNIKKINSRYDKAFVDAYNQGLELGIAKAKHLIKVHAKSHRTICQLMTPTSVAHINTETSHHTSSSVQQHDKSNTSTESSRHTSSSVQQHDKSNIRVINSEHRDCTRTDTVTGSHLSLNGSVCQLMTPTSVAHISTETSHRTSSSVQQHDNHNLRVINSEHRDFTRTDPVTGSHPSVNDSLCQIMTPTRVVHDRSVQRSDYQLHRPKPIAVHDNLITEEFEFVDVGNTSPAFTTNTTQRQSRRVQSHLRPCRLRFEIGSGSTDTQQRHIKLRSSYWSTLRSQRKIERRRDARRDGLPYPSPENVAAYRNMRRHNHTHAKRTSILQRALDMGIRYNNQRHVQRMFSGAIGCMTDLE